MKRIGWKPGQRVQQSGIYALHLQSARLRRYHDSKLTVTCVAGEPFPPHEHETQRARYFLVRATHPEGGR